MFSIDVDLWLLSHGCKMAAAAPNIPSQHRTGWEEKNGKGSFSPSTCYQWRISFPGSSGICRPITGGKEWHSHSWLNQGLLGICSSSSALLLYRHVHCSLQSGLLVIFYFLGFCWGSENGCYPVSFTLSVGPITECTFPSSNYLLMFLGQTATKPKPQLQGAASIGFSQPEPRAVVRNKR